MADDLEDRDLAENYRKLHAETGESWESIARRVEDQGDRRLAGWLRSQAAGSGEFKPSDEPPARSAPTRGSVAAAETPAAELTPAEPQPAPTTTEG